MLKMKNETKLAKKQDLILKKKTKLLFFLTPGTRTMLGGIHAQDSIFGIKLYL